MLAQARAADPFDAAQLERMRAMPPLDAFLDTLDIVDTGARTVDSIFTGSNQWMPSGRVFGGQIAAQSVVAASRTVDADRTIHSMRGYFLRPGDIRFPITYSVEPTHDGRSFSTRIVQAYQRGEIIWSMVASYQVAGQVGLEHAAAAPEGIPGPDGLPSLGRLLEERVGRSANYWASRQPFELRPVQLPEHALDAGVLGETHPIAAWVRSVEPLPDDALVHRAALAYVSDQLMLEPPLRAHGIEWDDPRLRAASLDHGVWWHRPARADEWLLFIVRTPNAHAGRAFSQGYFFDREGRLVASVCQEGMVRLKEPNPE